MEEIAISKFKATCFAVLDHVRRTGKSVMVTRFGEPIAEIVPPPMPSDEWLGSMRNKARIEGDIVSPATDDDDWEAIGPN